MKSLAENLKGVISGSQQHSSAKEFTSNAPIHPGLMTQSSNMTAGLEELRVTRGPQDAHRSALYD